MKSYFLLLYLPILTFFSCVSESRNDRYSEEESASLPMQTIFIGSYPKNPQQGIYVASFNPNTGDVSNLQVAAPAMNPSFLVLSPEKDKLYAVNELNGENGQVSSYTIDKRTLRLYPIDTISAMGTAPCYISLNRTGDTGLVANYGTGDILKVNIDSNGKFKENPKFVSHITEQSIASGKKPHAHSIAYHPQLPLIFVADLGLDVIKVYNEELQEISEIKTVEGAGPRHLTFNGDGSIMYVINELNSTIDVVKILSESQFEQFQTLSTLPPDFEGESYCADIHLHPSGKFLLGSNRGHDSIVVFEVKGNGTLGNARWITEGISWPRNFAISPDGNWVLVANQKGASITTYKFFNEGQKDTPATRAEVHAPVCIRFY